MTETAMGTSISAQTGANSKYVDAVARISDILFQYLRFPHLWFKPFWYASGLGFEFNRLIRETTDFTRQVITERRHALEEEGLLSNSSQPSRKRLAFLDLLLIGQKANDLTDEDIREEVDTFMFEGHDTTGSGMGFAVYLLGQYPEWQAKIHAELDEVFGESDRAPTDDDIKKLVVLERCVKESLRVFPSVPIIARRLTEDFHYKDVTLPEGMTLLLSPAMSHRNPKEFAEPHVFHPDHFLPEATARRHAYAYLPFSAGPRNCIGQKFALTEEKVILSSLFRRYRVETVEPFPGNIPRAEIVLKPSDGVRVRLYKR